ncbi:hypothetical protein ACFIOY_19190 [Bradyrhizobium sp. TZ2]
MALAHRYQPTYGAQFQPESIFTQEGHVVLMNFLRVAEFPEREDRRSRRARPELNSRKQSVELLPL